MCKTADYFQKNVQIRVVYNRKNGILLKSDYQFKGQLTENYVLQQLKGMFPTEPRYYATKNSEIDFLIQKGAEIIPIEVKGGESKSALSFKHHINQADIEYGIRFSQRGYLTNGKMINIPLYLVRMPSRQMLRPLASPTSGSEATWTSALGCFGAKKSPDFGGENNT